MGCEVEIVGGTVHEAAVVPHDEVARPLAAVPRYARCGCRDTAPCGRFPGGSGPAEGRPVLMPVAISDDLCYNSYFTATKFEARTGRACGGMLSNVPRC